MNPFNNFHAANLKEYISLDKWAKQDFRPKIRFDLIPGNSYAFSAEIKKCSRQFGYGSLLNVTTRHDVDATNPNVIIYKDHVNMINTWNKIEDNSIVKNANEVKGTRDWTSSATIQIDKTTAVRSKVGTAAALTKISKKKIMECWKSTIVASQVMALLMPEAQASIKIHKNAYLWMDPQTDELLKDGCLLLNEALKLIYPDVQANVYMELVKIKSIKPVDYAFNMVKWHSAIESKCILIKQKLPGAYHESQYIMDYLDASLTAEVKSFKAEINIIWNKYLRRNPNKWTASYISGEIIKTYNNMSKDGTWKHEIGKKEQIIALTTKVAELQMKLEKQIVSFATQAKKEITPVIDANNKIRQGKKDGPYTVPAWCLIKKEDTVVVNGKTYHWCIGEHYSSGTKHNGMYAGHKLCDHEAWQARIDLERNARFNGRKPVKAPKSEEAPTQKLGLNNKLRNAFCTQASLSAEAIDRIWEDAQVNE